MVNRRVTSILAGPEGKQAKIVHFEDEEYDGPSANVEAPADDGPPANGTRNKATRKLGFAPPKKTTAKKSAMKTASPKVKAAASKAESDTIAVQQKMRDVQIIDGLADDDDDDGSPLSDLEQLGKQLDADIRLSEASARGGAPLRDKGKGRAQEPIEAEPTAGAEDSEMIDQNEDDEGDIFDGYYDKTEDEDSDEDDDDDEVKSVISISSADEGRAEKTSRLMSRPWRTEGFNVEMRKAWEIMYCTVERDPIGNSWENTEDYQHEKDKEMLRYMEDFPLPRWSIPQTEAGQAYFRLLERSRWRTLGIKIYGPRRIPEIIPNATPFNRGGAVPPQQMGFNGPPPQSQQQHPQQHSQHYPQGQQRHHSMGDGRLPPGVPPQQHQMPYHPPHHPPPGIAPRNMSQYHPPPPQHMLMSQPHAIPLNVPPGQEHLAMQMAQQGQHMMQGPHPMYGQGQPPMSHAPHGLPYAVPPHMMGQQGHMPRPMGGYGLPPGMQQVPAQTFSSNKVARRRKSSPLPPTISAGPPTPPYQVRQRPAARKEFNKTGGRNMRKQAEALEYPWQRRLDFQKAKTEATWDESNYDKGVMDTMDAVRERNMPVVKRLDEALAEKQRQQRARKKQRGMSPALDESSDIEQAVAQQPEDVDGKAAKQENIGGDPNYSGNLSFASEIDRVKALALGHKTPDEIIDAAEANQFSWDLCKGIFICWNPGKKGLTQDLSQAQFRIYDTLITRKQLKETPILTRRAAECIVDFCPHMIWRETLLRIVSEAGYGNKDVRNRFCSNGCNYDKATITKRIASALGQKQTNAGSKSKKDAELAAAGSEEPGGLSESVDSPGGVQSPMGSGNGSAKSTPMKGGAKEKVKLERYQKGEEEWHEANKIDFNNYILYFGKRPGARIAYKLGDKRKKGRDGESVDGTSTPNKKARSSRGVSVVTPGGRSEGAEMEVDGAAGGVEVVNEMEADGAAGGVEVANKMEVDGAAGGVEVVNEGQEQAEAGAEEAAEDDDNDAVSLQGSSVLGEISD
ncbi:hypothetical protein LTR08_003699 [Meristemomyces frigidus]|nr:hypothetical protein LTR08_003699 [Meristemomyces frigidus]